MRDVPRGYLLIVSGINRYIVCAINRQLRHVEIVYITKMADSHAKKDE